MIILIIFFHIYWDFLVSLSPGDCYSTSDNNRGQFCQPYFTNILQNATAVATSTCGTIGYSETICNAMPSKICLNCNNGISKLSRDISLAFDHHVKGYETCWISGKLPESRIGDVINITINLDNVYEAYYITVEFCGKLPDSIVLLKSINYGMNWSPWHFFSSTCQKTFNMRRTSALRMERKSKQLSPVCFSLTKKNQSQTLDYHVIAFNPMIGRNDIRQDAFAVKQWSTLTNLRLSMIIDRLANKIGEKVSHIGISDIAIGGRAQCYGHAVNMKNFNQSIVCDCTHNTGGKQCNMCLNTHNDKPWQPILSSSSPVHECQKCFCNDHAPECTFNKTIYSQTNGLHGSQCINCLHHTEGPQCEFCMHGFYRDITLPINHTNVCQECKCHIIGANNPRSCDPLTGHCQCKEGVEGPTCNRCKKGFQQTRSSLIPCSPDVLRKTMATEERCQSCGKARQRVKFKKFCRQNIMIQMSIQSKEIIGLWTRFVVKVETIWRLQTSLKDQVKIRESKYSLYPIWVENANIKCNCPNLELGKPYLLLTKLKQKLYLKQPELIVDRRSTIIEWRDTWLQRLNKFAEKEKNGKCFQFKYRRRYSNQMFRHYRYMNDG